MGKALYRTYRSKKLSEIVGQEHITTALVRALKKGTISHAYLFTGPRGVGKTSIARILAHEVNGLPYDEDTQNLDIIEIDAASNRRIDEIRDLREKVHIAPTSAKYKVYIIDEVHMLTKEAFNALLKTLEEPPAHVIFILATTEAHKLPETIISRTQRYAFKPVELSKVVAHLRYIADQEQITITDDALGLIAAHGEGSFRDSISLLDQIRNSGSKVTLPDVQAMLGIAPTEIISNVVEALTQHDTLSIAKSLGQMHDQGYESVQVAKQISAALRNSLVTGTSTLDHDSLIKLLGALVQVPASPDPQIALEIALLDTTLANAPKPVHSSTSPKTMSEEVGTKPVIQVQPKRKESVSAPEPETNTNMNPVLLLTQESWALILDALKKDHSTLFSVAKLAHPRFEAGKVVLTFAHTFHQKRVNEARNKKIIADVIEKVAGSPVQITCVTGGSEPKSPVLPQANNEVIHTIAAPANPEVDTISNIFGSAELLES